MYVDDVGDDESHWQDRVSSGFDRLVAFASTELTKSRRSIEDGGPSTSRNTSPDSGINQSEGRTFLSTSSSSSQMDAPLTIANVQQQQLQLHQTQGNHLQLQHRITPSIIPLIKSSHVDALDSPPISEIGLPRTPSPSASPSLIFNSQPQNNHIQQGNSNDSNSLKIPLKYQRQSKSSSSSSNQPKHYKKKFRERTTWEYDYDDNVSSGSVPENDSSTLHKSSKFRPKGKDWGWRSDHLRNKIHDTDIPPV